MAFESAGIANIHWGSKFDLFDPERSGTTGWQIHPASQVTLKKRNESTPGVLGDNPPSMLCEPMMYQCETLYAVRFEQGFLNPEWGIIFPSQSVFFEPSAWAARYKSPDLSQVDGYNKDEASALFEIKHDSDEYYSGSYLVLNHWGGKNFGHFLYDSLIAVYIFLSDIISGRLKLVTTPLTGWQRSFLNRMGIPQSSLVETNARLCKFERVIFTSSLSGNIYLPSYYTKSMIDYMKVSGEGQIRKNAPRRIFVSRKNVGQRLMLNESDLESALSDRGFVKICPETMDVDQQISAFSEAEVIVGELGAALSNISFASRGCKVIEIMPELKLSPWIKNLCTLFELDWRCVYATVPQENRKVVIVDGIEYRDLEFSYNVNIEQICSFVDSSNF